MVRLCLCAVYVSVQCVLVCVRDSGNWELHVNQPNSAGILYNYLCILYIISNPSSLYTFNVKFGWILRLL